MVFFTFDLITVKTVDAFSVLFLTHQMGSVSSEFKIKNEKRQKHVKRDRMFVINKRQKNTITEHRE